MNHSIHISSTPPTGSKLVIHTRRNNDLEIYTRPDLEGELASGGTSIGRFVVGAVILFILLRLLLASPSHENVAADPAEPKTEIAATPRSTQQSN